MLKYPRLILRVGPRLLWDFVFYINRYARHPEKYPLAKRYKKVRSLVIFILDHYRIDWKMKGLENLRSLEKNDRSFLLVANHLSDLDPLAIIYWSQKPISFVAKKETLQMPFIGTAVKALGGLFMDREDLRQSFEVMKTVEARLKENYCNYVIFPEGTRNKNPRHSGAAIFHPGSFRSAMSAEAPILTLGLYGTFRPFYPDPDFQRNPIEMSFFPPINALSYQGLTTGDVAQKTHDTVENEVTLLKNEEKSFFDKGLENIPLKKGIIR